MFKALIATSLIGISLMNYSNAIWIQAKAELAQVLIEKAWADTLKTGQNHKPWHWADTWPVARIHHPASNTDLYVLEGAEGSSLAFGPGHHQGTALPGTGPSIVGGHRDTHFEFLKEARLRDELLIQGIDGTWKKYEISATEVRDSEKQVLLIDQNSQDLYLITCYPFEAIMPGGPLRYLVVASPRKPVTKHDLESKQIRI